MGKTGEKAKNAIVLCDSGPRTGKRQVCVPPSKSVYKQTEVFTNKVLCDILIFVADGSMAL
jgi:hypothetical protein